MRTRNAIEALTLLSNLYLISKDKELMKNFSKILGTDKEKTGEEEASEYDQTELLQRFINRAGEMKKDVEERVKEETIKLLNRLHVAQKEDVELLKLNIEALEKKINLLEARLNKQDNSQS